MTYPDWRAPSQLLAERWASPTPQQHRLAEVARIQLPPDSPRTVAEAMLCESLAEPLGIRGAELPTPRQLSYLSDLNGGRLPMEEGLTRGLASAWISVLVARRRHLALTELRPQRGDLVTVDQFNDWFDGRAPMAPLTAHPRSNQVVSSVSEDGRLNFRGRGKRSVAPEWVTLEIRAAALLSGSS